MAERFDLRRDMKNKKISVLLTIAVIALSCFAFVNGVVQSQTQAPPTYYGQVEAILAANCLGCHIAGGIAPFSLENPETVVRLAHGIKYAVENNIMPPWLPGPQSPAMLDERKLTSEDKATLLAWVAAGTPLGDVSQRPAKSQPTEQAKPQPDRIMAMDTAYSPNKSLLDDYRCFLLDPQIKQDTNIKGYDILPGAGKLVHHVVLFLVNPDLAKAAEEQDKAEAGPGWTCFGGPGVGSSTALPGVLGFWAPGTSGTTFPKNTGRLFRAGTKIVMQMHYNTINMTTPVQDVTKTALYYVPEETSVDILRGTALLAPVEVRCPGPYPTDKSNPCHRDHAMQHSMMKDVADGAHLLCGTRIDDYLSNDIGNGAAQETHCDATVRATGVAMGVVSHMHIRGIATKVTLNPDTPDTKILLDIPHWDFNWQGEFWYKEPIPVKQGDKLRISCTYDNSGPIPGPDKKPLEPRYLTWGEGTTDEMCLARVMFIYK
jgi:hypothetical protein